MKLSLDAVNAKTLGRAIQTLAKLGDQLMIVSCDDKLVLQAANSGRSAFGCVEFQKSFFLYRERARNFTGKHFKYIDIFALWKTNRSFF